MKKQRTLKELLDTDDPAWPLVQSWADHATNRSEFLPSSSPQNGDALLAIQVTTRSPMGAVVYETGGIFIDHGWLRVLGSGHPRLPRSLPEWNKGRSFQEYGTYPPFLLIADDVVGGFFALDGGGLGAGQGEVFYFAPDTLTWENMDFGYTEFLQWCFAGRLRSSIRIIAGKGGCKRSVLWVGSRDLAFILFHLPRESRYRKGTAE
jgi:Protein of unknown function DUF2625